MSKKKSILAEARSWAARRKLFGPQAFLRYVILRFAENLSQTSKDFVFKGGNLLWVYIATPRATTDLDLATVKTHSHAQVRKLLEEACKVDQEIQYSILSFKEVEQDGKSGAAVSIGYVTEQGAKNRFEVDIVYALDTDSEEIDSPVHGTVKIRSATLENIIADKLQACQRFGSGNSRMKDYDDLWRLSQSECAVDAPKLAKLLKQRKTAAKLELEWIGPDLERSWKSHRSKYKDLPETLNAVFEVVNKWLEQII